MSSSRAGLAAQAEAAQQPPEGSPGRHSQQEPTRQPTNKPSPTYLFVADRWDPGADHRYLLPLDAVLDSTLEEDLRVNADTPLTPSRYKNPEKKRRVALVL